MKIGNIELFKITKTEIETKEGEKTIYIASFENKEEGIRLNISQEGKFDLVLGENYSAKLETEQKKL